MVLNRVISFFKYLFICLLLLFVLILGVVNLPFFQRIISEKANAVFIEKELPVHVDRIKLLITGRIGLSGVRIIESPGDTILYAGDIKVSIELVPLIFHKVKIMGVTIDNATVHVRTDPATGELNIISIFSSGEKTDTPKKSSGKKWDISIGSVYLNKVKFTMYDSFNGIHIDQAVKELSVTFERFSLISREIFASYVSIINASGGISLSESGKTSEDTSSTSGEAWAFKLKDSDLRMIDFSFSQPDKNQKMNFNIADGMIYDAYVNLANHKISVSKLHLDAPVAKILSASNSSVGEEIRPDSSIPGFPGNWDISGGEMKITGGSFITGPYTEDTARQVSDSAFKATELNARFSDIRISSSLSRLNLDGFSFTLGNGFILEDGQFIFSSDSTQKTTLRSTLISSKSHINLSVESPSGLSELITSYKSAYFSMKIDDTEISAGDVFSFLPDLAKNGTLDDKRNFGLAINCDISGTADLLNIKNIDLITFNGASLAISGEVEGIRDPSSAKCSVGFKTGPLTPAHLREFLSFTSLSVIIPDFDPITIDGSVDSTLTNPQFHIALESHSGNMIMDGNINLDDKSYNLNMSGSHINLGKFSGINDLGIFTGKLDFSGKDFNPSNMRLIATLAVDTAGYKGYSYKNIRVELDGDKGSFKYNLEADDPSLKCDLTGVLNMNDSLKGGQIKGMLDLDANEVNLYKGVSMKATLEAGLNKSRKELSGFASVRGLVMIKDNNTASLKELDLSFISSDSLIKGKITSDFLKAEGYYEGSISDIKRVLREGKFRGIALIDSAVGNRIPYISLMQNLYASVEATYDPMIGLFINDSVFSYNSVKLKIEKDSTDFARADMVVHRFNLGPARGFNATISIERNDERSYFILDADSMIYQNISLSALSAEVSSNGDTATYRLSAGGRRGSPLYKIEGFASKSDEGIRLISSSEEWVINGYNWTLSPRQFLTLEPERKNLFADIHLKNAQRTIDITGRSSEKISFNFRNLELKMFLIPGMNTLGYDGEFSGTIGYRNGIGSEITFQMEINQMKMEEYQLGNMGISGKYKSDTLGNADFGLNAVMNDTSSLNLILKYGKNKEQRSLSTEFKGLPLIIIGSLAEKYISSLEGTVGGRIELNPVNGKPQIEGGIQVNSIGMKLVPVNARFFLPGDIVNIKDNKLLFSNFTVLDSLGNKLNLDGSLDLSDLKNITADMQVTSDNLQVMNTTSKDNPEFNGSVFVNSRIRLSGPLQKPSVRGSMVLAKGTVINYKYIENLAVSETEKMITFASLSEEKLQAEKGGAEKITISKSPDIEASLEINPNTLFNFEISKGYDIGVHISGGGFMTYSLLPSKAIDLTGLYEIREGSSELKIPGWPRKDFTITPGSYVRWDGQVDDPDLRMETTSRVRGSYVNPIDQTTREVNFIVFMKLAGRLSQLGIIFDVRSEDQYLTSVFNTMSTDERMRQAINLLIFGSVQLPNAAGSSDYMTQQINQFWESQINSFTKSAVKFVDLSMGIDSYKDPANGGKEHTSVSVQVKKDIFKDRGSVMVSGRMNDNTTSQQSNAVIENFIFEYALDSVRTNYLKVYRQQNYEDLLEGEVIKSGVGYIYRRNYDRISDIWRREKKSKEKK